MRDSEQKLPKRLIDPLQLSPEETLKLLSQQLESGSELVRRYNAGEDFPRSEYDRWFTGFQTASVRCFGPRSRIADYFTNPPIDASQAKERMDRIRQFAKGNQSNNPFQEDPGAAFLGIDRLRNEVGKLESWVTGLAQGSKRQRAAE